MRLGPLVISLIAALGGLLFGFHTSVLSGALLFLQRDFSLSTVDQEMLISILLVGAIVGAFAGGWIADRFGRKKTLLLTAFLFLIGTVFLAGAEGFSWLFTGRIVLGVAVGITSVVVPLYIAEIAPPDQRGTFVSFNQLLITVGIVVAYGVALHYSDTGNWRAMFLFGLFLACLQGISLLFIPETPSWINGRQNRQTQGDWKELWQPAVRKMLVVGIGVSLFQQITGINTVIYYAPQIFQLAGYSTAHQAIYATFIVAGCNVAMTLIALWLIDRIGRRKLLMIGTVGMAVSLAIVGATFFDHTKIVEEAALAAVIFYVSFFAISLGPCTWLIIAEIFPLRIRGRAMGIAIFANWLSNYLVSLTFLTLLHTFGGAYTFWLYGVISIFGFWFVYQMVPETKGKTLQQIQSFWKK